MASTAQIPGLKSFRSCSSVQSIIIVVPDLGLPDPKEWQNTKGESWLKNLILAFAQNSHVYTFDHGLDTDFAWRRIPPAADLLIDSILTLRKDKTLSECPIQFICLGIGGLILKHVMREVGYRPQLREILFVISGLAFIGTPHSLSKNLDDWKGVSTLPKAMLKNSKDKQSMNQADVFSLSSICEKFDEMNLDRPLYSAYETGYTTVKAGFSRTTSMIVGKDFCSVKTNSETLVSIKSDYKSLHCLDEESYQSLSKFVRNSIAKAQMRIMVELDRRNMPMPLGRTVRTKSITGDDDASGKNKDTGKATAGSTETDFEILPSVASFTTATRQLTLPCYMDKSRKTGKTLFARTEILKAIEDALLPSVRNKELDSAGMKTFALCGLGGVGKSEIASKFMSMHKLKFEAVFWIQADDITKLKENFSQMAIALNLEDKKEAKDQVVSTNIVKHWLDSPSRILDAETGSDSEVDEVDWLMIFDNVDTMDDLLEFWPEVGRKGSILLTSRKPLTNINIYIETGGVDLKPFEADDAARFLVNLVEPSTDGNTSEISADAIAIIERFGGLPLALEQMAGVMKRNSLDFSEFLKRYDSESNLRELASQSNRKLGFQARGGYAHTLETVWALDKLESQASCLLDVISLMDPDGIWEIILKNGLKGHPDMDFPPTENDYQEARKTLLGRSLITRNVELGELRVHRIIQDVTRSLMPTARLQEVFNATASLIYQTWPFPSLADRHHTSRWVLCESLVPNVIKLYELYKSYALPGSPFQAKLSFAELLTDAAWYLHERGGGSRFFQFLDLAYQICQSYPAESLHIISDIYYTRGAEAAETNEKLVAFENNTAFLRTRLKIAEQSNEGRRDAKLAQAYNQAANAYLDRNDFVSALTHYEQALGVFVSLANYKETMTTICVANLGTAFWLQGQLEDAERLVSANLKARELEFGRDDTDSFRTGRLLHVMGNIRVSQGKFGEAFSFHNRALLQYQATVGNNHHRTADMCFKMAEHWLRLGQSDNAVSMLSQASSVWESRKYYRPELARMYELWSKIDLLSGDESESLRRRSTALKMYRSILPSDSRPDNEIKPEDFDGLLGFQSR